VFFFSIELHEPIPLPHKPNKQQPSPACHPFEKILVTLRLSALNYVVLSILLLASNTHVMQ